MAFATRPKSLFGQHPYWPVERRQLWEATDDVAEAILIGMPEELGNLFAYTEFALPGKEFVELRRKGKLTPEQRGKLAGKLLKRAKQRLISIGV